MEKSSNIISDSNLTASSHPSEADDIFVYHQEEAGRVDVATVFQEERRKSRVSSFMAKTQDLEDLQQELSELLTKDDGDEDGAPASRKVRFDVVQIRSYPVVIGDNPGGRSGAPVSMGWEVLSTTQMEIDQVEISRGQHRRRDEQLRRTAKIRSDLLKAWKFDDLEIQTATKEAQLARRQRIATYSKLGREQLQERMESARRNLRNFLSLGQIKRQEKKYLQSHLPSVSLQA